MSKHFKKEENASIRDFTDSITDENLSSLPVRFFAYPWESINIFEKLDRYDQMLFENRKEYLADVNTDVYHPFHIRSHFLQFNRLLKSILKSGFFQPTPSQNIHFEERKTMALDNEWKWKPSRLLGEFTVKKYLFVEIAGVVDADLPGKYDVGAGSAFDEAGFRKLFDDIWTGDSA